MAITRKQYLWGGGIVLGLILLIWGGIALYNMGAKNALEKELADVEAQLQNTSGRSAAHAKLLGKKIALQRLLAKY